MYDIQRDRLKHLLANAIIELWKKETGSLSSVVIEGTICITTGSGRTTVVQVADKYYGAIPEAEGDSDPTYPGNKPFGARNVQNPMMQYVPHVDPHNAFSMAAYLDELSPSSLVSPSITDGGSIELVQRPSSRILKRSEPSNAEKDSETVEETYKKIKDEVASDDSNDESRCSTEAGPVCPGTGYYTRENEEEDERAQENHDQNITINDENQNHTELWTSTPKVSHKSTSKSANKTSSSRDIPNRDYKGDPEDEADDSGINMSSSALDLSGPVKRETDLALSPPQSYTAQVRDVIRQRLLANRSLSNSGNNHTGERPPATHNMPRMINHTHPDRRKSKTPQYSGSSIWSSKRDHMMAAKRGLGSERTGFQVPLSIGMPNGMGSGPSSPSPTMLSGYPPFMHHRPMTSPGSLHEILSLHRPSSSPLPPAHPSDDRETPSSMASDLSSPDTPDVNGNMDRDANGEQKIYKCDYCSKTFLFKSKYHEHLPVHTNARPFQCHLCSRTYKYKYDLRVHLRTHMGIPTKSTICPFCNAKFVTNKMLRKHIQDVHQDRQKVTEDECTQPIENLPPAL